MSITPDEREDAIARAKKSVIPVRSVKSVDAHRFIVYHTDAANRLEVRQVTIWNSRTKDAPAKLVIRNMDVVRVSAKGTEHQDPHHKPVMGEYVFISHTPETARKIAEERFAIAEEAQGPFKGTADEREAHLHSITARILADDRPVCVKYNGEPLG